MDEKAACLHAVAKVLGPPKSLSASPAAQDEDVSMRERSEVTAEERRRSLAKRLFERLGACNWQATGTLLVELVKRPVPEVRLSSTISRILEIPVSYAREDGYDGCRLGSCAVSLWSEPVEFQRYGSRLSPLIPSDP